MLLGTFIKNIGSAMGKMQDYAKNEKEGEKTTIVHPEVFSTEEEAKKAYSDHNFMAFYSSKKEFSRRNRGM